MPHDRGCKDENPGHDHEEIVKPESFKNSQTNGKSHAEEEKGDSYFSPKNALEKGAGIDRLRSEVQGRLTEKTCWATLAGSAVIEPSALIEGWEPCAIQRR